jgi:hypothetical protein
VNDLEEEVTSLLVSSMLASPSHYVVAAARAHDFGT